MPLEQVKATLSAEEQVIEVTEAFAETASSKVIKVFTALFTDWEAAAKRRDRIDAASRNADQTGEAIEVAQQNEAALEALENTERRWAAVILQDNTNAGAECSEERDKVAFIAEFTLEAFCHVVHPFHIK